MTGNSLAHKRITLRKHTKKLKSLRISVKQHDKAGTRALERDIALPKHRGYLLLTTEPRANRRSPAGQAADVACQDDGQETQTRVLSAFSKAIAFLSDQHCGAHSLEKPTS